MGVACRKGYVQSMYTYTLPSFVRAKVLSRPQLISTTLTAARAATCTRIRDQRCLHGALERQKRKGVCMREAQKRKGVRMREALVFATQFSFIGFIVCRGESASATQYKSSRTRPTKMGEMPAVDCHDPVNSRQ